ncbi:hypothetical protein [Bilophila sp.]|uniref:hypothetical protein n=1 Tax=Bilophila sp. TaxID=1929485 RepID=UPI0030773CB2
MPEEGTVIGIVPVPGTGCQCVIFLQPAIPQQYDFRYRKTGCHLEIRLMDGKEVRRHNIRVGEAARVTQGEAGAPGLCADTRGGAHSAAHAPAHNRLAREGRTMETHIPNRISTACEALNFISSYGRICEANDVKKPEMGGLAAVVDLVRGHLEVVEPVADGIAIKSKEYAS